MSLVSCISKHATRYLDICTLLHAKIGQRDSCTSFPGPFTSLVLEELYRCRQVGHSVRRPTASPPAARKTIETDFSNNTGPIFIHMSLLLSTRSLYYYAFFKHTDFRAVILLLLSCRSEHEDRWRFKYIIECRIPAYLLTCWTLATIRVSIWGSKIFYCIFVFSVKCITGFWERTVLSLCCHLCASMIIIMINMINLLSLLIRSFHWEILHKNTNISIWQQRWRFLSLQILRCRRIENRSYLSRWDFYPPYSFFSRQFRIVKSWVKPLVGLSSGHQMKEVPLLHSIVLNLW